jgi:hypothetical protein
MAVDVQEPHEMSALIDTQTRKLRAQLLPRGGSSRASI